MGRFEVTHLEAEEAFVEPGNGSRVGAVDRDADPSSDACAHVNQSSRNPDPAVWVVSTVWAATVMS
jgi:hypothetical protein